MPKINYSKLIKNHSLVEVLWNDAILNMEMLPFDKWPPHCPMYDIGEALAEDKDYFMISHSGHDGDCCDRLPRVTTSLPKACITEVKLLRRE
jgi:hypothetical protein